jgi:cytochrome P450
MPGLGRYYFANHPDYIKHILQTNYKNYIKKDINYRGLKTILGEGLLTNHDTESWINQRRLLQPHFHLHKNLPFDNVIVEMTQQRMNQWVERQQVGQFINLTNEMFDLVFSITTRILFGETFIHINPALLKLGQLAQYRVGYGLFLVPWLPIPANISFKQVNRQIDEMIINAIQHRRTHPSQLSESAPDFLTTILNASQTDFTPAYNDKLLIEEVKTFLLAGHETTGIAMGWLWYHLAKNPDMLRRLQNEIRMTIGDRSVTADDLEQLPYLKRLWEEAIRLYPPIWFISRRSVEGDVVGEYYLPPGSTVFVCPYTLHRHPEFWDDPETFDPDRHFPEKVQERAKFSYIPFGAGPRICIAAAFAAFQAQLMIATIAQRFEFENHPTQKIKLLPQISLRPKKGILMRPKWVEA